MPGLLNHPAAPRRANNLFAALEILVVDDMPAIRRMLRQMLQHLGVQGTIHEAGDGQEAWELLQDRPYDVVVCDINMPRLNGLDLLRRLRATPRFETTPFLMITGEVSEDIVAASAESEVDGYLLKPFRVSSLEKRLRAIVSHHCQPSQGEALFRRAQKLLRGQRPVEALSLLEQLRQPPFRPQAKVLNLTGECHQVLGLLEEASRCFRQALEINPKYLKAYQNLAGLAADRGDLAEARRCLQEAHSLSPLNADRLFQLSHLCLQAGDQEQAKQYLLECGRHSQELPTHRQAALAEIFLEAGLAPQAEELFRQALRAAPHDVNLYNRLGVSLRRQQKHRQALDCYQKALQLNPHNEKVHFNLGVLYFDLGEKDKAWHSFQEALHLKPTFTEARNFLELHYPEKKPPPDSP